MAEMSRCQGRPQAAPKGLGLDTDALLIWAAARCGWSALWADLIAPFWFVLRCLCGRFGSSLDRQAAWRATVCCWVPVTTS